jgi:hypothetical protein
MSMEHGLEDSNAGAAADETTPGVIPSDAEIAQSLQLDGPGFSGARPVPLHVRPPLSVQVVAIVLLVFGGALEGFAVALAAGDEPVGRNLSLLWAAGGSVLVVTAWAIRGGRWWAVSAALAIAIVGISVGVYGALGLITGRFADDARLTGIGLVAIGAASVAILGLISGSWDWFTRVEPRPRAARPVNGDPAVPGA